MISVFALSQVLAGIAILSDIISFQLKDRRHVLLCLAFSAFLMGLHFILLDQITAPLLSMLIAIRMITASLTTRKWVFGIFFIATLSVGIFTYRDHLSIISTIAALLGTTASFQSDNIRMRIIFLFASSTWLTHNTLLMTPLGIVLEIMMLTSNIIGLRRISASFKAISEKNNP